MCTIWAGVLLVLCAPSGLGLVGVVCTIWAGVLLVLCAPSGPGSCWCCVHHLGRGLVGVVCTIWAGVLLVLCAPSGPGSCWCCVHHLGRGLVHVPPSLTLTEIMKPLSSDTQWGLKKCQLRRLSDYRVPLSILLCSDCTS